MFATRAASREAIAAPARAAAPALVTAIAYFAAATLGTSLSFRPDNISALWPANAVVLAALLLAPGRWRGLLAALVVAELASDGRAGFPWAVAVVFAGANAVEVLLASALLTRAGRVPFRFDTARDLGRFLGAAVVAAPLVSAIPGALAAAVAFPGTPFPLAWQRWVLGDAMGALVVTPAIVLWVREGMGGIARTPPRRLLEAIALAGACTLAGWLAFASPAAPHDPSRLYVALPALLWAAFRFGLIGISTAAAALAFSTVWLTSGRAGPFSYESSAENVLALQLFLAVTAVPLYLLAAAEAERRQAVGRLRATRASLERTVAERTAALDRQVAAARESEARFRTLVNSMQDIVFVLDREERHSGVYGGWVEATGGTPETYLGKRARDVLGADAAAPHEAANRRALAGEPTVYEWTYPGPDGARFFQTSLAPLPGRDGRPDGVVGVGREVTAARRAEAALRESKAELERARDAAEAARHAADLANRSKSDFLARASHDLRSPLNLILGHASILLGGEVSPDQRQRLETIRRSGKHAAQLIDDLLELSRIESGELVLEPQDVAVADLLHVVGDVIAFEADAKRLAFSTAVAPEVPATIHVDARRLRRVLLNLLGNAVKFTDRGGVALELASVDGGARVRFRVHDTGPGIRSDELASVFLPFQQGEGGRRLREGSGLGLAICRNLVALMGGELRVESVVGTGAAFWFDLPVHGAGGPGEAA